MVDKQEYIAGFESNGDPIIGILRLQPSMLFANEISAETVGAGVIASYPEKVVTAVSTFDSTYDGQTISSKIFENYVIVTGQGISFENCVFRGPKVYGNRANLIDTTKSTDTRLAYCDINPQVADPHYCGVGYKNYSLFRCNIWGTTDALAAFALKADPDPAVHVEVIESWLHNLAQFKPDINRPVTHNDLIQLQGNVGLDDDVYIVRSRLEAYHSPEQGNPLPPEHTQIAAVMLTPNVSACQDRVSFTMADSIITGGVFTLNASAGTLGKSSLVLRNNVWEKPRSGGPAAAIAIDPLLTKRILTGNVYPDGTPVPVYNA